MNRHVERSEWTVGELVKVLGGVPFRDDGYLTMYPEGRYPMSDPKTTAELQALLPNGHIEIVDENGRAELVIYTGWSEDEAGNLIPMKDVTP